MPYRRSPIHHTQRIRLTNQTTTMKDNRLAKIFALGAACALAFSAAIAQTTTSVGANVGPAGVALTTSTGSFAAYTPGVDYFTFRTAPGVEPVRYYYTPETTVVDPVGHAVTWSEIRPDLPATIHYVTQGDRMIVKRVVLTRPVTVRETTTTTTTTTSP
jgi:hypothetical protein